MEMIERILVSAFILLQGGGGAFFAMRSIRLQRLLEQQSQTEAPIDAP